MKDIAGPAPLRLTLRSAVGGFMCAIGAFGVSCQGNSCTTGPIDANLSTTLANKYILSGVSDGATGLPYTYADSAGLKLRVWSDTLFLTTGLTYDERGRIGQLNPTTNNEVMKDFDLAGSNSYALDAGGNPSFPKLLAGSGVGQIEAGYTYASLEVTINNKIWYYFPISP